MSAEAAEDIRDAKTAVRSKFRTIVSSLSWLLRGLFGLSGASSCRRSRPGSSYDGRAETPAVTLLCICVTPQAAAAVAPYDRAPQGRRPAMFVANPLPCGNMRGRQRL